ncbi:hypothetical protein M9H77_03292 [Catharanthus roseus]|uniref:Uncharacterized protein n=1 Tax=Catharanthus roseus TaxID=4058 RepID=A0ACC0CBA1_CATRO|nr:hypothetical protein M9H77_03292 [Catharanthus roseus]
MEPSYRVRENFLSYGNSDTKIEILYKQLEYMRATQKHMSFRRDSNQNSMPKTSAVYCYKFLGHLPGLPWGQPQFQPPPDSPLGDRPTAEHDAMSTFSYVFTNRKANCPAIITDSSHKHFRAPKILIRQSSHAYANFTIMPMPGLYSCMLKHVTFQDESILQLMQILQTCHVYIHACQII